MLECEAELWKWIENGARIYSCGNARRMAVDVDNVIRSIIQSYGQMTEIEVADFLKEMQAAKRYCRDVY